jgi:aryl-alcohol dehydrogenase-like predicted oxidoreductase
MSMQRRSFFGAAFAGLASRPVFAKAGDIPRRTLGRTGEQVTLIGPAGGRMATAGFDEAKAIVRRAVDLGVNYFDNARAYWNGRSEEVMGAVLPEFRKQVFIATKSASYSKAGAEADLEASLKALKTDYIDLWQIHQVSEMKEVDQIFGPGGSIEAFEAAKKAGKVRFIGFTGHRDPQVHIAMLTRYDMFDTILMPLNPADPAYLSFEKLVLPLAVHRKMGIQAMKSTANAKLLRTIGVEDCLSYVLSLPVHAVAMGCTNVGQIEEDVRIAQQFKPLAPAAMADLRTRAAELAGPKLEDWKRDETQAAIRHHDA